MGLASYEYCPEALEEERRVQTVRRFCLPERWFVPANEVRSAHSPRHKMSHRAQCFALKRQRRRLRVVPVRPEPPVYVNATASIVELLTLNPRRVYDVYRQAFAEDNQAVLASLVEAVPQLDADTKRCVRKELDRMPDNRVVTYLRAAAA